MTEENDLDDLEANLSFSTYYAVNHSATVPFYLGRLKTALHIYKSQNGSGKNLFLYLHVEESEFSMKLCKSLSNERLTNIVKENMFLAFDVGEEKYLPSIKQALRDNFPSEIAVIVDSFIRRKQSILLHLGNCGGMFCVMNKILKFTTEDDLINQLTSSVEFSDCSGFCIHCSNGYKKSFGSREFQQEICNALGDRDYDSFELSDGEYLKSKIAFALFGQPQSLDDLKLKQQEIVEEIYKKILHYGNVLKIHREVNVSFLYNCCEPLDDVKQERSRNITDYDPQSDMMPNAIFCIKKCEDSPGNPCRIFIDNVGRVYKSWHNYIKDYKQEKCVMVLPKDGRYDVDSNDKVVLVRYYSDSCSAASAALNAADTGSSILSLGSAGVFIGAMFLPVAPLLLGGAAIVGAGVGVYSIVRGGTTLHDRAQHKQSMSISNSEARAAYFNITAGSMGFIGAGATKAVSKLASSGVNIGSKAKIALDSLNVINVTANGVNVGNQVYTVYEHCKETNKGPSALMVLQLSTSILFFGHSVYNFRSTAMVIEEAQLNSMKNIKDSMRSNRHRKTLNKYTKETIRQHGNVEKGRSEVIKSISKMENRNDVFAYLTRNNKSFNKNNIRFSADRHSDIKLNGVSVKIGDLSMNRDVRAKFLNDLPPIPKGSSSATQQHVKLNAGSQNIFTKEAFDAVLHFGKLVLFDANSENMCQLLVDKLSALAQHKLLQFVTEFFKVSEVIEFNTLDIINKYYPNTEPAFFVLSKLIDFLKIEAKNAEVKYLRLKEIAQHSRTFNEKEFDEKYFMKPSTVCTSLKHLEMAIDMCFANDGRIIKTVVDRFIQYLATYLYQKMYYVEKEKEIKTTYINRQRYRCPDCRGCYYK